VFFEPGFVFEPTRIAVRSAASRGGARRGRFTRSRRSSLGEAATCQRGQRGEVSGGRSTCRSAPQALSRAVGFTILIRRACAEDRSCSANSPHLTSFSQPFPGVRPRLTRVTSPPIERSRRALRRAVRARRPRRTQALDEPGSETQNEPRLEAPADQGSGFFFPRGAALGAGGSLLLFSRTSLPKISFSSYGALTSSWS
jgi:hypothetical protein